MMKHDMMHISVFWNYTNYPIKSPTMKTMLLISQAVYALAANSWKTLPIPQMNMFQLINH